MAESISLPELALIGISSSFFAGGLETVRHKWAVFLRLQTLLSLWGGVGGFSGGASGRVMRGHRVGSTKRFVVSLLIVMDGSDFICWPTKCFQCRLFFTCSFVFQNVTSVLIRTLHRLLGLALVDIEQLTFRFEGLGTTIGPKSNFFSSFDLN